jgi:hypothetical protein
MFSVRELEHHLLACRMHLLLGQRRDLLWLAGRGTTSIIPSVFDCYQGDGFSRD